MLLDDSFCLNIFKTYTFDVLMLFAGRLLKDFHLTGIFISVPYSYFMREKESR
jgi:hypothetical protein